MIINLFTLKVLHLATNLCKNPTSFIRTLLTAQNIEWRIFALDRTTMHLMPIEQKKTFLEALGGV